MTATQRSLALKIGSPTELTLVRADGSEHAVHPLWLREPCRDAATIDLHTQQRLQDPSDFDFNLRLLSVGTCRAATSTSMARAVCGACCAGASATRHR